MRHRIQCTWFGTSRGFTEHGFATAKDALTWAKRHVRNERGRNATVRKARGETLYEIKHSGWIVGVIRILVGRGDNTQAVCV